jgi:hypothetical protein
MLETITLKPHGFINNWLVCGPDVEDYRVEVEEKDQLKYETKLRALVADNELKYPPTNIQLNQQGLKHHCWKYYDGFEDRFVDFSTFYPTLKKVQLYAVCVIHAKEDVTLKSNLWTYAAVDMWLNHEKICKVKQPVYKPIMKKEVNLKLIKGENTLFVRLQNLGVRDTRNLFGIQIKEKIDDIKISTPDDQSIKPLLKTNQWMQSIKYKDGRLIAESAPSIPVQTIIDGKEHQWTDGSEFDINEGSQVIELSIDILNHHIHRTIEIAENHISKYKPALNPDEHYTAIYDAIAKHEPRKHIGDAFNVFTVLAKYAGIDD